MAIFHPGDMTLTAETAALAGFKKGDRILDLGCGDGESMSFMRDSLGLLPYGCDADQKMLDRAAARDPKLKLRKTDGVELDYPSLYFDGAVMECSFSLMDRHDELLHELYCVLKPGARLAISDLYAINPDPARVREEHEKAVRFLNTPHKDSDCEKDIKYPSPYTVDGVFVQEELIYAIRDCGFEIVAFRDKTPQLRDFYAQALMDYGSLDAFWKANIPDGSEPCGFCRAKPTKHTGYFILVAEKLSK